MNKEWEEIFRSAVQKWGKKAQVDIMIEEMAELTKELMNERRGWENNIAEEMADVQIMFVQMLIIFQNTEEVERRFREKIERLKHRLHKSKSDTAAAETDDPVKMIDFLGDPVPVQLCTIDRFGDADDFVGCGHCFEDAEDTEDGEADCDNCIVNCIVNRIFRE